MTKRKRYPGTLQQRGNSFRLHLCVGGVRHYFTIPTADRRGAEAFAIEKHRELARQAGRHGHGLPSALTCSALFDRFERQELPALAEGTQDAYRDSLKPIRGYFVDEMRDPPIDAVHARHVRDFLAWRRVHRLEIAREGKKPTPIEKRAPVSNRTMQKDRAVLHRIFELAEQLELRDGNPVSRVQPPKSDGRDPVILSAEEYDRLLAACDGGPLLRLYALTFGEGGLRCESEVLQLQWPDVDLEGGFLWVASGREGHRTKSGKGRWVPMTSRLVEAMRDHFAACRFAAYDGTRPVWVFHHARTARKHRAGDRVKSMRSSFRAAAKRAKLPAELHQHDLRHRRVTTWLAEGRDVVKVKEAMGHSDLRTTMGYTHLAREHLRALVGDPELPGQPKAKVSQS
jgi:integrase/recombinase XerD